MQIGGLAFWWLDRTSGVRWLLNVHTAEWQTSLVEVVPGYRWQRKTHPRPAEVPRCNYCQAVAGIAGRDASPPCRAATLQWLPSCTK